MKVFCALCFLCGLASSLSALDREAFTFTKYDLNVRIEPEQHRLEVRGTITLRNDSASPQKNLSLQISSSLAWRSIQVGGKPLQFVSQPYTSDIDHTGKLSEAVVTLPQEILPKGSVELEIGYEGVIVLDTTRLTQIGVPKEQASHTDWDQIGETFTAVRGVGYVVWYPVATEAASLADGNAVFETVGRWKSRVAGAAMDVNLCVALSGSEPSLPNMLMNEPASAIGRGGGYDHHICSGYLFPELGTLVPMFDIGEYSAVSRPYLEVFYFADHKTGAEGYANAAEKVAPFVTVWFGAPHQKADVAELPDSVAAPYESGTMLLATLDSVDPGPAEIAAVHQLTHAAFPSARPWIFEGLAHFAQALYRESQAGRNAALDSMALQLRAVLNSEKSLAEDRDKQAESNGESLVNTPLEELYRSKAMYVWWMLRDMVGEQALKKALAAYRPDEDKEPHYLQRLVEVQAKSDLTWFFDDWVYHDRGLPDFRVDSVYPTATAQGSFLVTVTVENLGGAGAEVPVIVRSQDGEVTKRLEVRGKAKNSFRVVVPSYPQEVVVNDGSVPESDMSNNVFKVQPPPESH